jgi:hypothetical protein
MPMCVTTEPDMYSIGETEVRCLLYVEQAKEAV